VGENTRTEPFGLPEAFTPEQLLRLHELANTPKKPWWRDYPLMIGGAGFVLSLATGIISAVVGYRKDIHDQQAQLAGVLQNIQELTLKQAEVYEKYKGTAYEAPAANMITAQVNTAVRTATDLALRLGTNATTAELATIAQGQYGVGDATSVRLLLEAALAAARNANDESVALRSLGFFKIQSATTPDARQAGQVLYARAMTLDAKYDLQSLPYSVHFLRATASLDWANAIAPFDCAGAQAHFAEGARDLLANPRTPEMDQMRRGALNAYKFGLGGILQCKPLSSTSIPP
jgi:hypothetical protein